MSLIFVCGLKLRRLQHVPLRGSLVNEAGGVNWQKHGHGGRRICGRFGRVWGGGLGLLGDERCGRLGRRCRRL